MAQVPEWRFDPLTGRRVLISPDRADRPRAVGPACPFCEGHEAETPPEVLAYRDPGSVPNGPGWQVRVVPNRYAAVRTVEDLPEGYLPAPTDEAPWGRAYGIAEVFVESPTHETVFRNLSHAQATTAIRAWRNRLRYWRDDGRLMFAQVFKNEGSSAGASVEHCHSQLIGLPFVPPRVIEEFRFPDMHPCRFCSWTVNPRLDSRFVSETDMFVAQCPVAPRFPGETRIIPKQHSATFENASDDEATNLVHILFDVLRRIDHVFSNPDYNLIVRSAPFRHEANFHWWIDVMPRTATTAGWEWGTGLLINTMFPERAAELLRAA
jgi:UDPglucose--hexose-1-phosphate uridylyltransferase